MPSTKLQSTTLIFTPIPPFDFKQTLNFLNDYKASGITIKTLDNELHFAMNVLNQPVAFFVKSMGTIKRPKLELTLYAKTLNDYTIHAAKERLDFYLSLDIDLTPFYNLAKKDDAFTPILKKLYGYHPVKFPTLFTCICWALVTQRTPNSFAYLTMQRFCELFGDRIRVNGELYTTFPEAKKFLNSRENVFIATNNTRKTDRLMEIANAYSTLDEALLKTASYEEKLHRIKKLKGIGQWSAEYILLRGLGRYERSPWTDTEIINAISNIYTGGFRISDGDARRLAEAYGWCQGLWAHYLKVFLNT
jgi:DNA-3-methyladenine glycosylase II